MAVDASQRQSFTGVAFTSDTFIGQVVLPSGAGNGIRLLDAINTFSPAKYPIAVDLLIYPTAGEPSILVELRTGLAGVGFPMPHIPTGGGAHPVPFRVNLSQITNLFLCEIGGADDANVAVIGYF